MHVQLGQNQQKALVFQVAIGEAEVAEKLGATLLEINKIVRMMQ
jgi:hypothetical protein